MGQDQSKAPGKSKVNQSIGTSKVNTVGSKPRTSDVANYSSSPFQEDRNSIDCGRNSSKMPVDNNVILLDKTIVGFRQQKETCPFSSDKKNPPNRSEDSKQENKSCSLNSNHLELSFELVSEDRNTIKSHEIRDEQHLYLATTSHQQHEKECKQSSSQGKKQPAQTSITQVQEKNKDKPVGFSTAHPLKPKFNKQPISISTQTKQSTSISSQTEQSTLLLTPCRGEKNIEQQVDATTSTQTKSQEQKDDKQSSSLTSPQVEKMIKQQVGVSTSAKLEEQINENYRVAFLSGQPLMQNYSSLTQKPKEFDQPNLFSKSQKPELLTNKPLNVKPLKRVITSGNPFLKSNSNGKVAKDIGERNVIDQSLIIPPKQFDTPIVKSFHPKEANYIAGIDTLGSPIHDSIQSLNAPLCPSEMNSSVPTLNNHSLSSKVVRIKGSTSDENVKKTLKHVEMIAESLTCSNDKTQPSEDLVSTEHTDLPIKGRHNQWMLHNCIVKMRNVREGDEFIPSLQKEIAEHLRGMELFTSVLKSCPIINSNIYSLCETIRGNLGGLVVNYETKNLFPNSGSVVATNSEINNPLNYPNENIRISPTNLGNETFIDTDGICKRSGAKGEIITVNTAETATISLNAFMALLDQLPESLAEEKQNVSLRYTELFCRVCEKSISFSLFTLTEHLTGQNHRTLVTKSKNFKNISVKERSSGPSSSVQCLENTSDEIKPGLNINLQPNYKGVLDLINQSVTDGLTFNVEVFICLICDFFVNEHSKASNHGKDHDNHQNGVWQFCRSCGINMFGTDIQLKDHYETEQHTNIAKIKECTPGKLPEESILDSASGTNENDRGSVCSSSVSDTSTRSRPKMTTHEILLAVAKTKKENNVKGPFGWYCQVCKKYTESTAFSEHSSTKKHIQLLDKLNVKRKQVLKFKECPTCEVILFGDVDVLREHQGLQVHKELEAAAAESNNQHESPGVNKLGLIRPGNLESNSSKSNCTEPVNTEPNSSEPSSPEDHEASVSEPRKYFNERGPHYEFMKIILKKNLEKKPTNVFFGLYCQVCELHFLEQAQWESHLQSHSHQTRSNSSGSISTQHNCAECNIHLICDEQFFNWHLQSLAHKAISRIPGRRQIEESESEEDYSEDENDSSENEEENEESTSEQENTLSNSVHVKTREEKNNTLINIPNGIYFRGFPLDLEYKEISAYFRRFGPVKSCKINRQSGTGSCVFKKKIDATSLLQKNKIYINKTPVFVQPLMSKRQTGRDKNKLHPDVVSVLSSQEALAATISDILDDMSHNFNHSQKKAFEIREDLAAVLPGCKVLLFGSQVTGLATGNSDFDIYVDYDGRSFYTDLDYEKQQKIIEHLQFHLTQRGSKFYVRETILEARVPIIRVVHKNTNTLCDISCRSGLSVENSQLVKVYLDLDPRVRWLVVAVKFWMQANGLLDRSAFTSYATVWLVLFFLMRTAEPVVCPVATLQRGCHPYGIARWDCRFHRDKRVISSLFRSTNRQSELELLSAFFLTYSSQPFKCSVMCPLNGIILSRKQFETLNLPPEFHPYVDKVKSSRFAERLKIQTPICLQDPFDLSHNITKGVSNLDLKKFRALCHQSYQLCYNLMTR